MNDLGQLSSEDLLALARQLSLDASTRESDERLAVVCELQERADELVWEQALAWCRDEQPALRASGAELMSQLGAAQGFPFREASVAPLEQLLADEEADVIASALVALGHLGLGRFELIDALATHASELVREAVACCLGGREEEGALATLILLSSDEDRDTRNWATFGLGTQSELDRPELRRALLDRLEDPDHEVRGEAMVGLAARGDERVRRAILKELRMDDVSSLSVQAAALLPDAAYLEHLEVLDGRYPGDETIEAALESCRSL